MDKIKNLIETYKKEEFTEKEKTFAKTFVIWTKFHREKYINIHSEKFRNEDPIEIFIREHYRKGHYNPERNIHKEYIGK